VSISYIRHMVDMAEGANEVQKRILAAEKNGRVFKSFAPAAIPGKLQTREYARTRLTEAYDLLKLSGSLEETVATRLSRGELLGDGSRSYHVIIAEHVLHGATAHREVMREQLDHLLAMNRSGTITLGILPDGLWVKATPLSHFDIVDDSSVMVETMAVTVVLEDSPEVGMYLDCFHRYSAAAWYGEEAEALISRAKL
jgi:Domain of unknown function (DUF5753)